MSLVRVVSYNIHKGRSALGWRESMQDLRQGLHGLGADLAFLQEVQGRNDVRDTLHSQHQVLANALRLEAAYGRNAVYRHTDHGNALLSRFPILGHHNQDISDHRLEQRGLLHARVDMAGRDVHCFVVHLGLLATSRRRQAEALVDRIRHVVPIDAPVLIAGDFNDWNNALSAMLTARLRVSECFTGVARRPARTFPALLPWLRLDRIYQRGFEVRRAEVLGGSPWTRISDHAPLLAELALT